MPVPSSINDLSTTAGANSPSGSETPGQGDDYLRVLSAFLAQIRDKLNGTSDTGTIKNPVFSGASTGTLTLAGATLPAPIITGTPEFQGSAVNWAATTTHDGAHTWSGAQTYSAAAVFNGAATFNGAFTAPGLPTSGTYTPTLTNAANISASTPRQCTWIRVGSAVTVAGQVTIQPTASSTVTTLVVSLPVASSFTTGYEGGGTAARTSGVVALSALCVANAALDAMVITFNSDAVLTGLQWSFSFTYEVI